MAFHQFGDKHKQMIEELFSKSDRRLTSKRNQRWLVKCSLTLKRVGALRKEGKSGGTGTLCKTPPPVLQLLMTHSLHYRRVNV